VTGSPASEHKAMEVESSSPTDDGVEMTNDDFALLQSSVRLLMASTVDDSIMQ
jgi:hypothetical protein